MLQSFDHDVSSRAHEINFAPVQNKNAEIFHDLIRKHSTTIIWHVSENVQQQIIEHQSLLKYAYAKETIKNVTNIICCYGLYHVFGQSQ